MTNVSITSNGDALNLVNGFDESLIVDAFDPSDLLAGSLAKCTRGTVLNFAKKNNYDIKSLEVKVDLERDRINKTSSFNVKLYIDGNLSDQELRKLKKIADKSYIRRLLSQKISLESCFKNK